MRTIITGTALIIMLGGVAVPLATAQYSDPALKCRASIAKSGAKYVKATAKTMAKCHKKRGGDAALFSTDCNDPAQADPKNKLDKKKAKLRDAIGGVKDKCAGLATADLSYFYCPVPCLFDIGATPTFSDVADCIICQVEQRIADTSQETLGGPLVPLEKVDSKCHASLAKDSGKQMSTLLKGRSKCQNSAEKAGTATDTAVCAGEDNAKITGGRTKAEARIGATCIAADLSNLDSCSDVTLDAVKTCVLDEAETQAQTLFLAFYALGNAGPTTTTTSTTTTTVPPFTWTHIQTNILTTGCAGGNCHTAGQSNAGVRDLDLFNEAYDNLVDVDSTESGTLKRIQTGDALLSYFMHKLDGTHLDPPANGIGGSMPLLSSLLPQPDRDGIRSWINSGAPKN